MASAGERRGDSDERWLFDALTGLLARSDERPTLLLENVRAITDRPLRAAMTRWRTAMRHLGYTLTERVTAASSAGAAHRRLRWFALAVHPDSGLDRLAAMVAAAADSSVAVHDSRLGSLLPTTTAADAKRGPDSRGPQSTQTSPANALLPTTVATDAAGVGCAATADRAAVLVSRRMPAACARPPPGGRPMTATALTPSTA